MISDVDIKDWENLTEPIEIDKLKVNDLFSLPNDTHVFKVDAICLNKDVICGLLNDDVPTFVFPNFLKIVKWQKIN